MRRQWGGHPERPAVGMRDFEAARVQVQAMPRRASGELRRAAAILAVAKDRRAERGAMDAQLMRAPGNRQQRDPARLDASVIENPVIGDRALAALVVGMHALTPATTFGAAALRKPEIDAAPLRARQSGDDRPV